MGVFYSMKIKEGVVNEATEKAWVLADVPKFWKFKTESYLKANA